MTLLLSQTLTGSRNRVSLNMHYDLHIVFSAHYVTQSDS